jgi:dihydroorotate dehydrogenase (fumarate)
MANTKTTYLGLDMANPVVVSSSGLTNSTNKIEKLAESGAGAVVLKSIFEEQINFEAGKLNLNNDYPEAVDYIQNYTKSNSLKEYLSIIEQAKKKTEIPVIASVNCINSNEWIDFSKNFQNHGADALELNVFFLPTSKDRHGGDYEKKYLDLIGKVIDEVNIPVAVKIGPYFSNLLNIVEQLHYRKAKGVVLFNRFYEPDIDIESLQMKSAEVLSNPSDIRQSLRWVGLVSSVFDKIDIAASTGVHNSEAAVKQLLAGATAVQVCSVLYKNGLDYLSEIVQGIKDWMVRKGFDSVDDFRGKMNYSKIDDPAFYERAQFMKYFSSVQ